MRTSQLRSVVLGLSLLAGCTVGDPGTGTPSGGPDAGPGSAGDAAVGVQRVDVSVDMPTVSTELLSRNMITVTLASSGGFTGPVTLAASLVDAANAPITGWQASLNATTIAVPADGTATAVATVTIPSDSRVMAGTLRVVATSSLGEQTVTSALTAANQVTIPLSVVNNQCVYPAGMTTTRVAIGTQVRFLNTAADGAMRIHFGGITGLDHAQVDTDVGQVYQDTPTAAGIANWYCHTPGNNPGNLAIEVVAAQ